MTKDETGKHAANDDTPHGKPLPGDPIAKDPKGKAQPHPGHQVPHGSGEGATGMQPGAGHPRGR